ncbi:hypothetical protein DAPPUDRAFT_114827 [Daphnia pulex]|uniref:Uncharacterized protein n=1 Tax=Daphnia pulex TaxID=6669 RepID=E9HJC8_DAPPU|nr:hypothetical protein DAPPUDRAFT_114827 [Daphnia pulex]|eukprot:EFX68167.1 hypothetical protein DAPPUDRAFT_114827 [Daphnia pulex]
MNTNEAAIAPDDAAEPMPPPPPPSSVTALFYGAAAACFRVTLYRRHPQVLVRHRVLLQWTQVFARTYRKRLLDDDLAQELELRIVIATGSRRSIVNLDSYVIETTETTSIDGLVKAKLQIKIVVQKSSLSILTVCSLSVYMIGKLFQMPVYISLKIQYLMQKSLKEKLGLSEPRSKGQSLTRARRNETGNGNLFSFFFGGVLIDSRLNPPKRLPVSFDAFPSYFSWR